MLYCLNTLASTTAWMRTGIITIVPVLLLAACAVGPDYQQPEIDSPAHWQGSPASGKVNAVLLAQWWTQFNDPVLDELIKDALAANIDLQTAQAQLREARARRDMTSGKLWPSVDVSAGAGRSKGSAETGSNATRNFYNAGFDASWELDIFGGLRRGKEAAEADWQASAEMLHNTRITLVAEVARNYIELRTGEKRLAIAEASVQTQTETFALVEWRHQAGMVSGLDTAQAQTQLEQTRASLPMLRITVSEALYRLAILLGRQPGELNNRLQSRDNNIPVAAGLLAAGIPADTLRQRPDVRAAAHRLHAQTARLGEAEAARYPSLRLSGSLGLEALSLSRLGSGDAGMYTLLAGISAPVFDAGRLRGNIAVQDAVLEQARLAYRAAVLTALEDVENALVALANIHQRQQALEQAVASARESAQLTQHQYNAGMISFQYVLDSQRTLFSLEDLLASNTGDYSSAQVRLYKALGEGREIQNTVDAGTEEKEQPDNPGYLENPVRKTP